MLNYSKAWDDFIEKTNIWNVQVCNSNQESYGKWSNKVVERVKKLVNEKAVVVDLGCGTGSFCNKISFVVKRVIGFDVSKKMLRYAKENQWQSNIIFREIRNGKIPKGDETVSLVNSTLMFQHIRLEDLKQYLKESFRILRKGGLLHFQITAGKYKEASNKEAIIQNLSYSEPEIRNLLLEAKFEVARLEREAKSFWVVARK